MLIYIFFIDIVNKNLVILSIYLIIYDRKPHKFEVGTDLVESAGLRSCFNEAYLSEFGVRPCFEGFERGQGGVGARYNGLSHIDSAGLMFAESVEGLVDHAGTWRASVDEGEVAFLNFTALLHFSEERGVLFATCHQKKSTGFAVESAHKRKEFIWVLVAKPVDEGEGAVRAGGVDEPSGRFIDDQKRGVF